MVKFLGSKWLSGLEMYPLISIKLQGDHPGNGSFLNNQWMCPTKKKPAPVIFQALNALGQLIIRPVRWELWCLPSVFSLSLPTPVFAKPEASVKSSWLLREKMREEGRRQPHSPSPASGLLLAARSGYRWRERLHLWMRIRHPGFETELCFVTLSNHQILNYFKRPTGI